MLRYTVYDTPIMRTVAYLIGVLWLKAFGWRVADYPPDLKKYILLAVPHTSNWDFLFTLAILFATRNKVYWMGKKEIFKPPFGLFFRWLGGIPIDRDRAHKVATQTIRTFRDEERFAVVIPPEGTRKAVSEWKRGFYLIARGAKVPLVLGYLDYGRKCGGYGPAVEPSGDVDADIQRIKDFYADKAPRVEKNREITQTAADS
jgi:1-acyl-sn-glycerol-3-phosphate acyltransferase